MTLHSHSDKKIKSCKICQRAIKDIIKAGKELDKLGIWDMPKKFEKGIEYTIWRRNKMRKTRNNRFKEEGV